MARKKTEKEIEDYRHSGEMRKNIPPAKIAAEGVVPLLPKVQYAYSPRRSPTLRFDTDGLPDKIQDLLDEAALRPLTSDELDILRDVLADQEPWLEWAEKQEQRRRGFFEVDPVALHIHERVRGGRGSGPAIQHSRSVINKEGFQVVRFPRTSE